MGRRPPPHAPLTAPGASESAAMPFEGGPCLALFAPLPRPPIPPGVAATCHLPPASCEPPPPPPACLRSFLRADAGHQSPVLGAHRGLYSRRELMPVRVAVGWRGTEDEHARHPLAGVRTNPRRQVQQARGWACWRCHPDAWRCAVPNGTRLTARPSVKVRRASGGRFASSLSTTS